jgi:hypothetical protein
MNNKSNFYLIVTNKINFSLTKNKELKKLKIKEIKK